MKKLTKKQQKATRARYTAIATKNRLKKGYKNYLKRFHKKVESMDKRNIAVADRTAMTFREYKAARENMAVTYGKTTNINQTLVADQVYEYDYIVAQNLKKYAKKYNKWWADMRVSDIREAEFGDLNDLLTDINEDKKKEGLTGTQRARWIAHEVFGSE